MFAHLIKYFTYCLTINTVYYNKYILEFQIEYSTQVRGFFCTHEHDYLTCIECNIENKISYNPTNSFNL